jgi:hypothetical protein
MRELLSHHSGAEHAAVFAPVSFCARFVFGKTIIYQDRLGTGISRTTQAQRCVSSRRPAATAWKSARHAAGAKMPLFALILYKMHYFTKTGSGQTQGKLKKRGVFSQNQFTNYSQVCESDSLEPFTHKCTDLFTKTGSGQT